MIELLSITIKDGRVISLIHKYLDAGVIVRGSFEQTRTHAPQGGPRSPLLSNIMLNELDEELSARGHRFVRYSDDLVIFTKSRRSASRVLCSVTLFVEEQLRLKVNIEKSKVTNVSRTKFIGHGFYVNKRKGRL